MMRSSAWRHVNLLGYLVSTYVVLTVLGGGHGSAASLDVCLSWGALLFLSCLDTLVEPTAFFLVAATYYEVMFVLCRTLTVARTYLWMPAIHVVGAVLAVWLDPSRHDLSNAATVALVVTTSVACLFTIVFFWIDRSLVVRRETGPR